jgi:hypothetical protein
MKPPLILFAFATAVCAQPTLAPPQVGFFQDGANSFRPLLGIAGNFVLGNPALSGVLNAAYSGSSGLVKTDTSVIMTDNQGQALATTDAPSGPALFAFRQDASPAFAYFASAHLLYEWSGTGFQTVPFDAQLFPPAAVRAIFAPDAAHVGFLVQRVDGLRDIRVLTETGEADSQAALAGVTAPALILNSGELVYTCANGIVIRRADASEIHIPAQFPVGISLSQMGTGWAVLTNLTTGANFALRTTPGRESLYLLPEVSQ